MAFPVFYTFDKKNWNPTIAMTNFRIIISLFSVFNFQYNDRMELILVPNDA